MVQIERLHARDRADAAFDTFLTERGGGSFDHETAAFLLSGVNHMNLAGDLLQVIAYLENQYGIRLNELEIEPDDLRSVDKILTLIDRSVAGGPRR